MMKPQRRSLQGIRVITSNFYLKKKKNSGWIHWNITVIKGLSNYTDEYTRKCQILDRLIPSTTSSFPSREIPINKFDLPDNSSRIVQSKIPNHRAFIRLILVSVKKNKHTIILYFLWEENFQSKWLSSIVEINISLWIEEILRETRETRETYACSWWMTDLRFLEDVVRAHVTFLSIWMAAVSVSLPLSWTLRSNPLSPSLFLVLSIPGR